MPPVRVVFDSDASLPLASRLARSLDAGPVWVICAQDAPLERRETLAAVGVRVLPVPRGERGVDIGAALRALHAEGLTALFLEGGGRLGSAFLRHERVQRLYLFYAPVTLGEGGVPAFAGERGADPVAWRLARVAAFGEDVLIELYRGQERGAGGSPATRRTAMSPGES